jgi:uncharacterized protein (TIGR02996 family)
MSSILIPEGFFQAILDNPGNKTTRLVLSDWMEENGFLQQATTLRFNGGAWQIHSWYTPRLYLFFHVFRGRRRNRFRQDVWISNPIPDSIDQWAVGKGVWWELANTPNGEKTRRLKNGTWVKDYKDIPF